jgi:uncharacterized membrane protein
MRMTLVLHIISGGLGLVAGFIALYASKGARLHRKAGMAFVFAMVTAGVAGLSIAAVRDVAPALNIPAAVLTVYLVVTALTTVRAPFAAPREMHAGAMLVALVVGLISLTFGLEAIAAGGKRNGMPAFPFFMFGVVGLLASAGDFRILRLGSLRGAARLVRHLWRMSFALFIAALSFFIGQANVFPKPVRIRGLLALPVLAVLVTMLYWLWRVRLRRSLRGIVVTTAESGTVAPLIP